jgi:hypothetical protein
MKTTFFNIIYFLKNCILSLLILLFTYCSSPDLNKENKNVNVQISDSSNQETDSVIAIIEQSPLSNPVLMYGSSFGNYFQAYYKIGNYDLLMNFTSKESIDRYGYKNIINAYKKMEFGYKIKFKSMTNLASDEWLMNYETEQYATLKMLRIKVKLENDTVKLVINDLKNIFQD